VGGGAVGRVAGAQGPKERAKSVRTVNRGRRFKCVHATAQVPRARRELASCAADRVMHCRARRQSERLNGCFMRSPDGADETVFDFGHDFRGRGTTGMRERSWLKVGSSSAGTAPSWGCLSRGFWPWSVVNTPNLRHWHGLVGVPTRARVLGHARLRHPGNLHHEGGVAQRSRAWEYARTRNRQSGMVLSSDLLTSRTGRLAW
jgi:hypothetical protein